jgi:hypothetical protein
MYSPFEEFLTIAITENGWTIPISLPYAATYLALYYKTPAGQEVYLVALSEDSDAVKLLPPNFDANFVRQPRGTSTI